MGKIFNESEEQKKISEFMLENDKICMRDLIQYVLNHLSLYPTMHESFNEYQTENGRKFGVLIKEKE